MLELWTSFFLYSLPVSEPIDIEIEKCNENELYVRGNDSLYSADFFNVTFYDQASRLKACDLLKKAKHIQMEIDPLIHQGEPLLVYLFIDSSLLQKQLIEQNLAVTALGFQDYKYYKAMKEAENTEVMGEVLPTVNQTRTYDLGYLITIGLIILVLWLIMRHI